MTRSSMRDGEEMRQQVNQLLYCCTERIKFFEFRELTSEAACSEFMTCEPNTQRIFWSPRDMAATIDNYSASNEEHLPLRDIRT